MKSIGVVDGSWKLAVEDGRWKKTVARGWHLRVAVGCRWKPAEWWLVVVGFSRPGTALILS